MAPNSAVSYEIKYYTGCPQKIAIKFGKNSSSLKSGQSINSISLDRENIDLLIGFDI